jgi:hypothetical protein
MIVCTAEEGTMDFFTQFMGGLSVILICALLFGETVSGSEFMGRPTFQRIAVLLIMLLGVLAGIAALAIGLGFAGPGPTGVFGRSGVLVQFLCVGIPLLIVAGAVVARVNLLISGLLLAVGCVALLFTLGFNQFAGVPLALAAIAGVTALVMVDEGRAPPGIRGAGHGGG